MLRSCNCTALCRSLDNCTFIQICDLTNKKRERLHHRYCDDHTSSLIGQSEIRKTVKGPAMRCTVELPAKSTLLLYIAS